MNKSSQSNKDDLIIEQVNLDKETFSTEEVCTILHTEKEMIYYWTSVLKDICNLKIILDSKKRIYFKSDVEILLKVKELYDQDKTITEITNIFENEKMLEDSNVQVKNEMIEALRNEITKDMEYKLLEFKNELLKDIVESVKNENKKSLIQINESIGTTIQENIKTEIKNVSDIVEKKVEESVISALDKNETIKDIRDVKIMLSEAEERDIEILAFMRDRTQGNKLNENNSESFIDKIKKIIKKK